MKKILTAMIVLIAAACSLFAAPGGNNGTGWGDHDIPIWMYIFGIDDVSIKFYTSDGYGNRGSETDKYVLERREDKNDWYSNFILRIRVATTHQVKVTIGTDGPLAYDRDNPEADTIDFDAALTWNYWESDYEGVNESFNWICGTKMGSSAADYTTKEYFTTGKTGWVFYDTAFAFGYIQVHGADVEGKEARTYTSHITVTATVI